MSYSRGLRGLGFAPVMLQRASAPARAAAPVQVVSNQRRDADSVRTPTAYMPIRRENDSAYVPTPQVVSNQRQDAGTNYRRPGPQPALYVPAAPWAPMVHPRRLPPAQLAIPMHLRPLPPVAIPQQPRHRGRTSRHARRRHHR